MFITTDFFFQRGSYSRAAANLDNTGAATGEKLADRHELNWHDQPSLNPRVMIPDTSDERLILLRKPNVAIGVTLKRQRVGSDATANQPTKRARRSKRTPTEDKMIDADKEYIDYVCDPERIAQQDRLAKDKSTLEAAMGFSIVNTGVRKSVASQLKSHPNGIVLLEQFVDYSKGVDRLKSSIRSKRQRIASRLFGPSQDIAPLPQTTEERKEKNVALQQHSHLLDAALTCTWYLSVHAQPQIAHVYSRSRRHTSESH